MADNKYISIPGTPIKDNESGREADVKEVNGENALVTTGSFTGTVSTTPPTDRRFGRFDISTTAVPLVFSGFSIKGISIKADQNNTVRVRIGESDLVTANTYTVLEPGEVYSAEINGSLNPIYAVVDSGLDTMTVYVAVLGDVNP